MEASRWPRVMVPESLIFFRVPVSSLAKAGLAIRAAAMAALSTRGTIRMNLFLDVVLMGGWLLG